MPHSPQKRTPARASTPVRWCSNFFPTETIANYLKILNLILIDGKQKTQSNHDDGLAELNVQHRACWFNNQTDCAAPAPQGRALAFVYAQSPVVH